LEVTYRASVTVVKETRNEKTEYRQKMSYSYAGIIRIRFKGYFSGQVQLTAP